MANSGSPISDVLRKYIEGNYTPEELEQLLSYLQQEDTKAFDEQTLAVWTALQQQENKGLNDEQTKLLDKEARQLIRQAPPMRREKWVMVAAAMLLLALLTATAFGLLFRTSETAVSYRSVKTENGQKKETYLMDGSSVYLNAGSHLAYPEQFQDKTREVTLEGEAFFNVAPDSRRRFIVKTSNVAVQVLGTSFNVKNYQTDHTLTISVSTGKVAVVINDNRITLLPDEQLCVDRNSGEFEKKSVSADKYAQWRSGTLYFDHTPLAEVAEILERWYNVDIRIDSGYAGVISGEHDNQSIRSVLDAVCFTTGLKYKQENNRYIVY